MTNSDNEKEDDNVVAFKRPQQPQQKQETPPSQPLLNLPPITKYFLGIIVAIHLVVTFLLSSDGHEWVFLHLGFIPGRFTGSAGFEYLQFITPMSHMLLHGSWLHIIMNSVMLLAFGSGVEKWFGGKTMIILFIISGLFGIATHFALNLNSFFPVVGASGGLSGLFAVALLMLHRQNSSLGGKYGIWPIIILWIGISVLFGVIGSPDGSSIAWAAHIGGFLGGFAAMKLLKL